jgi:hypothetical protein
MMAKEKINLKATNAIFLQKWQTCLKAPPKIEVHNEQKEIKEHTCTMIHL